MGHLEGGQAPKELPVAVSWGRSKVPLPPPGLGRLKTSDAGKALGTIDVLKCGMHVCAGYSRCNVIYVCRAA